MDKTSLDLFTETKVKASKYAYKPKPNMLEQRAKPQPKPEGVNYHDWKNRYQVAAKLKPINMENFRRWCKKNKFNFNSGINRLIATHPEINPNYKDHA